MRTVYQLPPADAALLFPDAPARSGLSPAQWDACCAGGRFLTFAAEEGGRPVGFALAESQPRLVHVLDLEGDADACRLLLERVVRAAGERDVSVWCSVARPDLRGVLRRQGFARRWREDFPGRPADLYYCDRNEGL